jgi:hypothetical protein
MFALQILRPPARALAVLLTVAALSACGENGWSGLTGVGGNDSAQPEIAIVGPDSTRRVAVGDSVLVQVNVHDDLAIDSVVLEGFSLRGSAELGSLERVQRFAPKVIAFRTIGHLVRDTALTRYLLPTSDSLAESPVYIVATVSDTVGNRTADTVAISVGGPRITILEPVSNSQIRAGGTLRVRVEAADSVGRIAAVRVRALNAFQADTTLKIDPSQRSVDTVVVLTVPSNAKGSLQLQASARSVNQDSAVSNPAVLEVLAASQDVAAPSVTFSVANRAASEVTDSVSVTVKATDSTKVASVGLTVVPSHRKLTGTQTLPVLSLTSASDSATFRFTLQQLGVVEQSDTSTVRLEVTAFATDTAGNCGAATVPGTPLSEACLPGSPTLTGHAGSITDLLLVRGTTVVPAVKSDTLADLATDGKRVFVSNFSRNRIEVMPVTGSAFTDSIAGASAPWGLAVGNNGDTLYVANNGGTNISVVSLPALSQVRLLQIPDVHLYSITYDVKTDSVSEVVDFEYSDHPQYIAQIASGQLLYSTSPTPTRSDGTVRIFDPKKDLTYEFGRASEIFTGYATDEIGQGVVVNALDAALSGSSRLYVCPRRLHSNQTDPGCITLTATAAADSLTKLRLAGLSDTRLELGTDIETVGLTDTTFVAVSGDHSTVAFGEGGVNPGRIFQFRDVGGQLVGSTTETRDLVGNAAERVIGLGLNADGSLGMARFDKVYFFDQNLRQQGSASAGIPAGGGAMDPRNSGYPGNDGYRRAFSSGVDGNGRAFVDILNTARFNTVKRVYIRDRVIGGLIAVPVSASDPESGTLALRLFAITGSGVVQVELTPADLQ